MGEGPLDRTDRTVYQKDLYEEKYSLNVRIDSDKLEDGDRLRITVEKAGNAHTQPVPNNKGEKDLRDKVRYKISKVVNGFVIWLMEKQNGL